MGEGTCMNEKDVKELMEVAVDTAQVLGFGIAENCQTLLQKGLERSSLDAPPLAKGKKVSYPVDMETKRLLARVRVAEYTVAMAADALRNGPPPDMLLHEFNFKAVKKWICPLWPVC
jgi:hypothetical protein